MELAPEDKVNMSLDDLIKAKRLSSAAAKKAAPAAAPKASNGRAPKKAPAAAPATATATGAGRRGRRGKGGAGAGAMDVVPAVRQKVARNLGEGKAKREAAVDKRRGLNATGKATKQQMDLGGAKEVLANRRRQIRRQSDGNQKAAAGAAAGGNRRAPAKGLSTRQPIKSGLKISFKPADLNKTTDKSVAMQIKAVLSKQRGDGGKGAIANRGGGNGGILGNAQQQGRSVQAGGAKAGGGGGGGRAPAKGRSNNRRK